MSKERASPDPEAYFPVASAFDRRAGPVLAHSLGNVATHGGREARDSRNAHAIEVEVELC